MMDAETIKHAAEIFARAKIDRIPLSKVDDQYIPRDEADGYAIQNKLLEICESRGLGAVKGYKVGLVNAEMRAKWAKDLGFDWPNFGGIPEKFMHADTVTLPYEGKLANLGVEGEFAVRISKDIPPDAGPFDRESIQEYIGSCCAGMEIVEWSTDYYAPSVGTPNGSLIIADGGANGGAVFSEGVKDWARLDLGSLQGIMLHNGEQVNSGYARDLQGHPFNVLVWLVEHMHKHGRKLHADDRVLLGSVTIMYDKIEKGSEIIIRWDELGEVKATFS